MNLDNKYFGSRYLIKYHPKTNKYTFYLSGPTYENRQTTLQNLTNFINDCNKNNLASFSLNSDVFQDIKTNALVFNLIEDQNKMIRVIASPTTETKSLFTQHFGQVEEIDLGVIPSDKGFDEDIKKYYQTLSKAERAKVFNLHSLKFNAWDNNFILLGLSITYIDTIHKVNNPIETRIVEINKSLLPSSNSQTKIEQQLLQNVLNMETSEEITRYIMSQFSSLLFMKQMSEL